MRLATGALIAADLSTRTLTYTLVPYGEIGHCNYGPVRIAHGVLTAAALPLPVNLEHDKIRPVAQIVSLEDTATHLRCSVVALPTRAGDDYLIEAHARVRSGISVEVDPVTVTPAGEVTAGTLIGAAAVVAPAFPSATLTASEVAAATDPDTGGGGTPIPPPVEIDPATTAPTDPDATTLEPDPATDPEDLTMTDTDTIDTAPVEQAATAPVLTGSAQPRTLTASDASQRVADAFRAAKRGGSQAELMAALVNITQTTTADTREPHWMGEVWRAKIRPRPFIDSVSKGTLTADGMKGWAFTDPPTVADYAGDKADVPSDTVTFGPVAAPMARLAVAHDVDRVVFDFNETELIEAYWHAVAESYARLSEARCAAGIIAAAPAGAAPPLATTPAAMIVAALMAVQAGGGTPTFVALGSALWSEILTTGAANLPTLLQLVAAPTLGDGSVGAFRMFYSGSLAASQIVAGDGGAFLYGELSDSPIRVEAQHVAQGGVDLAGFGYTSVLATKASALYKATRAAAR